MYNIALAFAMWQGDGSFVTFLANHYMSLTMNSSLILPKLLKECDNRTVPCHVFFVVTQSHRAHRVSWLVSESPQAWFVPNYATETQRKPSGRLCECAEGTSVFSVQKNIKCNLCELCDSVWLIEKNCIYFWYTLSQQTWHPRSDPLISHFLSQGLLKLVPVTTPSLLGEGRDGVSSSPFGGRGAF